MAGRAGAADPNRTGARPSISVLMDIDTLEVRAGHPVVVDGARLVTAEAGRRLACDADISRLLTGPDGTLVDLGRTTRAATADQWRLLRLRDGGCTWPACDRPPGWCQAHHILWWEHGGPAHIDNLTHHRYVPLHPRVTLLPALVSWRGQTTNQKELSARRRRGPTSSPPIPRSARH